MKRSRDVQLPREIMLTDRGLAFVKALAATGAVDVEELVYLLDKPWKHEDEFQAWLRCGRPRDASDAGWSAWLDAIGEGVTS